MLERKSHLSAVASEAGEVARLLRSGAVVAYPTDTVWGLGCDATNVQAIKRIYDIKKRSDAKAMIVLVDSIDMLYRYVDDVPDVALQLIEAAVDPLTIIYDRAINLPVELVSDDGSIAIRITREEFSRQLCRRLGRPVVSTSANISGEPTARYFGEISPAVLEQCDYVVQCRRDDMEPHKPSSIIKLSADSTFKIIRK